MNDDHIGTIVKCNDHGYPWKRIEYRYASDIADLPIGTKVYASKPQDGIKWEELTQSRLAYEEFDGLYWLATKWGSVIIGEYRWHQGRIPHRFVIQSGMITSEDVTHIAPVIWPNHPNKS